MAKGPYESISESPLDCQRALVNKVILTGGTTMFPGLSTRVLKDLKDVWVREKFDGDRSGLARVPINVVDPPRRKHGVFIGASFVANFKTDELWISKKDWQETGPSIFFRQ